MLRGEALAARFAESGLRQVVLEPPNATRVPLPRQRPGHALYRLASDGVLAGQARADRATAMRQADMLIPSARW